jgi:fructose-1,6-bisphosphatase I
MPSCTTLSDYCSDMRRRGGQSEHVGRTVLSIAGATSEIATRVGLGSLAGEMGAVVGGNAAGDTQKLLDVAAHEIIVEAIRRAPVAALASEELNTIEYLDSSAPLAVAIDPLDGSSNIDANMSIGTIFSILPSASEQGSSLGAFGGKGSRQLAAGMTVYGPQTTLILTTGAGVEVFTLDRRDNCYKHTKSNVRIPERVREYAINASNYRHWQQPIQAYIDDCLEGSSGIRGADFNMRWIGSLVAEAFRILSRGGIFLYPADERPGYAQGRLRLLYEAAPIAYLIEQAGGLATTGRERITDMAATSLHQRVPFIFGSEDHVRHVERMHTVPDLSAGDSPLFAYRGLFRA